MFKNDRRDPSGWGAPLRLAGRLPPLAGVLLPALAMPQYPALLLAPAVCSAFHATIAGAHCRNGSALRRSLFMMQLQKAQHSEQPRVQCAIIS